MLLCLPGRHREGTVLQTAGTSARLPASQVDAASTLQPSSLKPRLGQVSHLLHHIALHLPCLQPAIWTPGD